MGVKKIKIAIENGLKARHWDNISVTEGKDSKPGHREFVANAGEDDEIYHLDSNDDYWNRIRQDYHGNVQVDINDSKYPDARPGDSTTAVFWFNYCPMCGRKLGS